MDSTTPLASSDVATEDVPLQWSIFGNRLREVPWHCRNNIAKSCDFWA